MFFHRTPKQGIYTLTKHATHTKTNSTGLQPSDNKTTIQVPSQPSSNNAARGQASSWTPAPPPPTPQTQKSSAAATVASPFARQHAPEKPGGPAAPPPTPQAQAGGQPGSFKTQNRASVSSGSPAAPPAGTQRAKGPPGECLVYFMG
jgi:hypothetical protein